jgi:soluble cytochrome b562
MNKLLIVALLSIFTISSNAEEIKQSKSSNKKELSKEDETFMKEFTQLNEELKQEKSKTIKTEKELEEAKKTGKTLDEIGNLLGVKYKDQK